MAWIAIYRTADGVVEDITESVPERNNLNGRAWKVVPDALLGRQLKVVNGTLVEDVAAVEAALIKKVKAINEGLVRSIYSLNYGKQKKYSRKQQEVLDWRALTGTLGAPVVNALVAPVTAFLPGFNSLTTEQRRKKFRFCMAQAALRGVGPEVIVAEFEARIEFVEDKVAAWEAMELEGIRAIKAATTADGKRAAEAAINWSSVS